jgi:hypothetical protein
MNHNSSEAGLNLIDSSQLLLIGAILHVASVRCFAQTSVLSSPLFI